MHEIDAVVRRSAVDDDDVQGDVSCVGMDTLEARRQPTSAVVRDNDDRQAFAFKLLRHSSRSDSVGLARTTMGVAGICVRAKLRSIG